MKKDHLEVLLEDISDKLSTIAEGHSVLDNKIERLHQENDTAHKALFQMIKETGQVLKTEINNKIEDFRQENEVAHQQDLYKTKDSYNELDTRVTAVEREVSQLKH